MHPVSAVQIEYNPWSLEIEGEAGTNLLATCRELGVAVVAYSPLGRGLLTGNISTTSEFATGDNRPIMPRFSAENLARNQPVVDALRAMAERKGCTIAQLTLAWVLAQGDDFFPIPGTKRIKYLEDNVGALKVVLTPEEEGQIRSLIDRTGIAGTRGIPGILNEYADTPPL